MKRIKAYLLLVLLFCCVSTVRAATNTVDYTSVLQNIYNRLVNINMRTQTMLDSMLEAYSIIDDMSTAIIGGSLPNQTYWTNLGNSIIEIRDKVNDFKPLFQSSLSDLDSILYYVTDSSLSLQDLKTICDATETTVISIDGNVSSIVDALPNLSNMSAYLQQIQGQIQSILDNGELNKEATQMQIVNILTGMTDTADSIKDALDIMQQEGGVSDITDAISALRQVVLDIFRIIHSWDENFFRYLYDRTFPNRYFEFYHISGSPFFENGYLTYSQQIGTTSPYSFIDWLAQVLTAHTQGLQVINDNILFIAKTFATNGQDQVMQQFEQDANDTVSTLTTQYQELINSSGYTPQQFDSSYSRLYDVRGFVSGLAGVQNYESGKVHNMDFSSFQPFLFPSNIDYKYDISNTSSFWEVCRAFFTCVWLCLFASVFFMFVRVFYKFYHICFNALAGNRAEGYEVSNIPLHW